MEPANTTSRLLFYVNGKRVADDKIDPETTLLQYLRRKLLLTGTKLVCGEGGCGACTVMVSHYDHQSHNIRHLTVNACLVPVWLMHGRAVTTVEGIGSVVTGLHPVQERIAKAYGSQCGFCTPGIVMSMYALLRNNPQPSIRQMEESFDGNLCRCTGYRPILDGYRTFTKEYCAMGDECCRSQKDRPKQEGVKTCLFEASEFAPYDPHQEPIFPPHLQLTSKYETEVLDIQGERVHLIRPVTLQHLLELKALYPKAPIIIGNSEIGIESRFKNVLYPVQIAGTHVPELKVTHTTDFGVVFGSSITLSQVDTGLKQAISVLPEEKCRIYVAIVEMLKEFAGHQIRNAAAIGGNIMTASPISDLNQLFLASGTLLTVMSAERGERTVKMGKDFFVGYRRTCLKPDEVLLSVLIPFSRKNEYFAGFKQAYRREDDIAIVNAGFRVLLNEEINTVKEIALSYGGMAATTVMAQKTEGALIGRRWDNTLLSMACNSLPDDLPLEAGSPGGMCEYRRTLTLSFFFKFYVTVRNAIKARVPLDELSITTPTNHPTTTSSQLYEEAAPGQLSHDPINRPIVPTSAFQQATGEAIYVDDMPQLAGEKAMCFVCSTQAHARVLSVDTTAALSMPGVVGYVSHADVPASNHFGVIRQDEEVFASTEVVCQGQLIGGIIADTWEHAHRAAQEVKVEYDPLDPILTIQEAIAQKSYLDPEPLVRMRGDVLVAFTECHHILEGEMSVGGQEHFYLEPTVTLCVPRNEEGEMDVYCCSQNISFVQGQEHFYLEPTVTLCVPRNEDGEMDVYCCSQNISFVQLSVAKTLGVAMNKIAIRCKRLGGGFGGKETRSTWLNVATAVAARKFQCPIRTVLGRDEDMAMTGTRHPFYAKYKFQCPIRTVLGRDEDMAMTGTRHPFYAKYKVGYNNDGKIEALQICLYANAGFSLDLSGEVMHRAVLACTNAYTIPNVDVRGYICRTNLPSNTAFRGFGAPQSMLICETWVSQVAEALKLPEYQVREMNLVKEGDLTVSSQPIRNVELSRCWEDCMKQSDFLARRNQIVLFNSENRWRKRGISIIPTQYGVAFGCTFLNQAGALVHVYRDGSVLVSHGGVEMGQGLYTKMKQVASRALGIPMERIHTSETSTTTVPNTSPTAASLSSDLNGMAILNACKTILHRLEPYMEDNLKGTWDEWISAAYFDRVSLSSTGYYATPEIADNQPIPDSKTFNYFTHGVGCSEVEIDCLTGDHKVLRTDIVFDVGTSLNPGIDIGQIEGAFVQGYGLFMLEEQKYTPSGFLLSRGPGTYKIPGFANIPLEMNVSLLKGASNPKAVYSSKAIGEPPLFMASSVFFAAKEAITSARAEHDVSEPFPYTSPATPEKIRLLCSDRFTDKFPPAKEGTYTPWYVQLS